MKDKDKGITIIEILTVTTMVLFVIFGSLFTVKKGHEARLEGEKTFVKRVMDSGATLINYHRILVLHVLISM